MEIPSRKKFLQKNLKLLQKSHPFLACQISMTDPEEIQFCQTQEGELNLVRTYNNLQYFYHSAAGAKKEAQEWYNSLDLHKATVIILYGVGLGYYYDAAKPWLKKHPKHKMVFIEPDLAVLHRLFEAEMGGRLLNDPQVSLFYLQNPMEDVPFFNELSWSYYEEPFLISALKLYEEVGQKNYLQLHHQIVYAIEQKKAFVDEYMHYGLVYYRNLYPNLMELDKAFWGNGLFKCFQNIPAIICGAGPSLNKNIELLKGIETHALIFAGGSALSALLPKGITPHFGVAIDPNKEQYSRIAAVHEYPIPFFYRNRLFHEALAAIKGPRLYLTGSGGYQTAHWFEKQLRIDGEDLDEGHNVVNFSMQIAQALGCNPIILVGVDLALSDQRFYAEGISAHLHIDEQDLTQRESEGSLRITTTDIYGKPVDTLWKWVAEARWISTFAKTHPEIDFINATEGGIGFEGIPNGQLKDIINDKLKEPKETLKNLEEMIRKHPLKHINKEKIFALILKMKESLDHCVSLISKLIEECDQLSVSIEQGNPFRADLHTPSLALLTGELEEETGYQYLLEMFNQVFLLTRHRTIKELQSKKKQPDRQSALKMLEIQKEKWVFLRDVAQINRELIVLHQTSNNNS